MNTNLSSLSGPKDIAPKLNLSSREQFLIGVNALFSLGIAYLLFFDVPLWQRDNINQNEKAVATIAQVNNDVKRKPATAPIWESVSTNEPVFYQDQIFTDADSSAIVKFSNETEIYLEPNSLIVIEPNQQQDTIHIKKGTVLAKTKSKKLDIRVKNNKAEITQGSKAIIQANTSSINQPATAQIQLLEGHVEVKTPVQTQSIRPNESVELTKNQIKKISKLSFFLEAPQYGQRVFAHELVFHWQKIPTINEYLFELSKNQDFNQPLLKLTTRYHRIKLKNSLPPGTYYWRISAINPASKAREYSSIYKFDVHQTPIPSLKWPPDGAKFQPEKPKTDEEWQNAFYVLFFEWSALNQTISEIQIAQDPQFSKPVLHTKMQENRTKNYKMRPGRYYWRVRYLIGQSASPWSTVNQFDILVPEKPKPLLASVTQPSVTAPVALNQKKMQQPTPAAVKNLENNALKLAAKPKIKNKPTLKKAQDNSWQRDARKKLAVKLEPVLEKIQLMSPDPATRLQYRALEPDINFKWRASRYAKNYEFMLAQDPYFDRVIIQTQTKEPEWKQSLGQGEYYWRVRALADKNKVGPWSSPGKIKIDKNNQRPEALIPPDKTRVDFDSNEPRILKFAWKSASDLEDVRIVIAKDKNFSQVVGRVRADDGKNTAQLEIAGNGDYYWFIEGKDKKEKVTVRSDTHQFKITTTTIKERLPYRNNFKIYASYNPGQFNVTTSLEDSNTVSFSTTLTHSYLLGIRGWLNQYIGIELEGGKRKKKIPVGLDSGAQIEQELDFNLTNVGGALKYRYTTGVQYYPIDINFRLGYYFNQVVTFYDQQKVDTSLPAGTLGLQTNSAHHLLLGVESSLPLTETIHAQGRLEYLLLLASFPAELSNSMPFFGSLEILQEFFDYGILGYGMFYRKQAYKYSDKEFAARGTLDATFYGLLVSLGWLL